MKRALLLLLIAFALPNTVSAKGEKFDITCFYKMEDDKPEGNEYVDRFIIDTNLEQASVLEYEKPNKGKKILKQKRMAEYINSPVHIKVTLDLGYDLGVSYLFDKENIESTKVTDLYKEYGKWYEVEEKYQIKYQYFKCKKTSIFD